MFAEALDEHRWLTKLAGQWTFEATCDTGADSPPLVSNGTQNFIPIGELWIVGEGTSTMPDGGPAATRITLGYDPQKERFVGSWIGSMMTYHWVYEGTLDAEGRVLTLDAVGPSFSGDGAMAKYQDVITIVSDDHHILTSRSQLEDGTWNEFLTAHYRRTK